MPQSPRTLVGALCVALLFPTLALANGNVKVSRFWHNHQPIYWPEWNGNWNGQPNRVQFARDSIDLKGGQLYDSGVAHPENDLVQIFGVDDRKKAYQDGPRNSLAQVNPSGGYAMSYSGSLIDNVASLGRVNYGGYGSNWWDGNRTARNWTTPSGSRRMELVGFTYHHSLAPVLPKAVFRKELQIFHEAAYKAWNTGSVTNRSKGFFPTEMAFSRHMIDVLADEGYQWVIVPSHHLSRTLPSYMGSSNTSPEEGKWTIFSSPPNKADQINAVSGGGWWFGTGNVGETAYNHAPFAYQLHKAKYVDPETGVEKTIIMVPSDDIQSYKAGYSGWQKGLIDANISPHANDPSRPCIVMPATDGDNAWGGGSSSWDGDAPGLMNNGTYPGVAVQDFVNQFGGAADTVHIEDGAWIFPESCYGSPNFLKWVEPPANPNSTNRVFNTQVDMETPGFTPKFYSWAPIISGANWCETAEQMWIAENGAGSVAAWKIQDPYDNLSGAPAYSNPNIVERAWHVYLAGLDSGFQYYGGEGNDDEVKTSLATRRAVEMLSNYVNARKETLDNTPPTVLKPQRFPYNPGGYTFGWFNSIPGNNNALKKMRSEFYIWTHAYDVSGVASIVVKIRKDKDGSNPLATNQNETYAGGGEVESWVTIPMNKRVLPTTAAALTAAANNSKISYFSQALSPEVADYYWAKVSEDTLAGFRGKLLDYYIEATDARGKVSKSEIQHVWVEDDGLTPSTPTKVTGITAAGLSMTSMRISWFAATGATTYKIFRGATQIGSTSTLTYDDTGLNSDTSYTYTVTANNAAGDGTPSDPATGRTLSFIDANPLALLVTTPTVTTDVASSVTSYAIAGQMGAALTNGVTWTNLLTGGSGSFAYTRDWIVNIPLGTGSNQVVFAAPYYAITGVQTNATDSPANASYGSSWNSGSNGGNGLGAWELTATTNAGHFLADGTTTATNLNTGLSKGFGFWANNGGVATARRTFNSPLSAGSKFNIRFDNNWLTNGSSVGIALADNSNGNRVSFYFIGGENFYRISDAAGPRPTTLPYTDAGLDLTFEVAASNSYTLRVGGNIVTNGTFASGGDVSQLVASNNSSGTNTPYNFYLGAMSITETLTTSNNVSTNAPAIVRAADDSTTDGLPNTWWDQYGLTGGDRVAADDHDKDGFTNEQEYVLGTDPTNPRSRFEVTNITRDGSETTVEWTSSAGKKYRLYSSPSLTAPNWQPVAEVKEAEGNRTSDKHSSVEARFYRVHLIP